MEENNTARQNHEAKVKVVKHAGGGMVYFVGFIGAAVYYIGQASSFGEGVIGFLKALVWPAFLVYYALQFLQM